MMFALRSTNKEGLPGPMCCWMDFSLSRPRTTSLFEHFWHFISFFISAHFPVNILFSEHEKHSAMKRDFVSSLEEELEFFVFISGGIILLCLWLMHLHWSPAGFILAAAESWFFDECSLRLFRELFGAQSFMSISSMYQSGNLARYLSCNG